MRPITNLQLILRLREGGSLPSPTYAFTEQENLNQLSYGNTHKSLLGNVEHGKAAT
jgi:hypothetical protein